MRNTKRVLTSLLLLCTTAMLWVGCSSGCYSSACNQPCDPCPAVCDNNDNYEQACPPRMCPEPCAPIVKSCEQRDPCPPVAKPCEPICNPCEPQQQIARCEPICPPRCEPPCPPRCEPVCPPRCEPVCPPSCPPRCEPCPPRCEPVCPPPPCDPCGQEPLCKVLPKCAYPSHNELNCVDGITVSAKNPEMCLLGEQYPLEFEVKACDDVCNVVVSTNLPEGVSYMRSQPEASVQGRTLTWNFGSMKKCQVIAARVWLKCECEGELCACFCASAQPVRFCSLLCAKPILVCHKCGPEECKPGDPINYTVTVTNRGSCTATGVVLTDPVPDGLEHSSGLRTLTYNLGCLEPCQTKKVSMCFTACKRGEVCNTATVTACNAEPTSCSAKCLVCAECAECVKVGPKEVQIGRNADYQIIVTNTGDKPLTDIVVTDYAPSATSIVAANGARICGNQAVWRMKQLNPGEKATFNITLTSCTPGCFTNRVSMTNCQGCNVCCEYTTRWRGRPALTMCINDTADPICIGDPTSYNIEVTNQGSESDHNVVLVLRFPPEITPESVSGDVCGSISGQTVTFQPYNNFSPRQTIRYRVTARGKASGDGRVIAEVSSDSIKKPIVQQESTIVN
ncbi:Large cysteine-rich periplasmic protein OmcB [Criblamydia sequanensis CRIB-18]|uniref:60 kDa outer membrane protein n=2 Tax=Candidatus Criblamydia sequanensis TaxID=340071 RepID=A0A090E3T8_9BACT|nr:Large cysteine-rich periplasmic protein OmcB [Criblamydia sequanensis CRIB-18]